MGNGAFGMKGWKGCKSMGCMCPWSMGMGKGFGKAKGQWGLSGKGPGCGAMRGCWEPFGLSVQEWNGPAESQLQLQEMPVPMHANAGQMGTQLPQAVQATGHELAQCMQASNGLPSLGAYMQMMAEAQGAAQCTQAMADIPDLAETIQAASGLPMEKQLEVQQAAMAAQQAQLLQQIQFQTQNHQFETQQMAVTGELPVRFKEGFRPLQLCKRNLRGTCPEGEGCRFAHAIEELHPLSPDLPQFELPGGTDALAEQPTDCKKDEPQYRIQKKRAMCNRLGRGGCLLGKHCPFAHSEEELGTTCRVLTGRVKAKLCKYWEAGKCIYGRHCVNAHGLEEIGSTMPEYLVQPSSKAQEQQH